MYVPGVTESTVDAGGFLTGAQTTILQNALNSFYSQAIARGLPMYILHTTPPDTATEVTSVVASNKVATQRRRVR